MSEFARLLNKTEDMAMFANRSQFYKNIWHADSEYFCPRDANGVCSRGGEGGHVMMTRA